MADEFSEEEIRRELQNLGYHDVPPERLARLKADLETFVAIDRSKTSSDSTRADDSTLHSSEYVTTSDVTEGNHSHSFTGRLDADRYRENQIHVNEETEQFESKRPADITDRGVDMQTTKRSDLSNEATVYSFKPTYSNKESDYPEIPEEIMPRIRSDSYGRYGYHDTDDLQTYYVSVPERDLLTGYRGTSTENLDTTATSTSTTTGEKKKMKRKVLRKVDGEKRVDESITESETDEDVLGLMRRLTRLPLDEKTNHQDRYTLPRRPYSSSPTAPAFRLPDDYDGPKSLIRPMTAHPHTRNIRKSDPVTRHQMYQQSWEKHKRPDEKSHKSLRWSVREQMLYHDEVTRKTQRTYVPNSYVVPSDKKRKALRWQIRQDMAGGVVPQSQWY